MIANDNFENLTLKKNQKQQHKRNYCAPNKNKYKNINKLINKIKGRRKTNERKRKEMNKIQRKQKRINRKK